MNNSQPFFINDYDEIYTVKLAWDISQPFVCGTLHSVVEYALKPNNGIEYFAVITYHKVSKISKKELKSILERTEEGKLLSEKLFKIF